MTQVTPHAVAPMSDAEDGRVDGVDVDVDVDVVVVGAGLAGLTATRDLVAAGCRVRVMEARDRVGGRTWSEPLGDDGFVDLGGQWIGPTQDRVVALAAELGVDTFATYADGKHRYDVAGRHDIDVPQAEAALTTLDEMAAEVPTDAPWLAERAKEWDGQTLQTWLDSRVDDPAAMAVLRLVMAGIFTAEPSELSLLHVVTYIASAGSLGRLMHSAQRDRLVGGAQTLSVRLAERLGAGTVWLGAPVRRVAQADDLVVVESDAGSVSARRAVVAVPVALADRIAYVPPLPAARAQLHQRVAPGTTFKIHCVYDQPFWRDRGLNGRALSDAGPVSVTYDNSPPSGMPGVLVGFIDADDARRFSRLDDDARRKAVVDCLVDLFGQEAASPRDYIEMTWTDEEWTRGCFGSNFPPGAWTRYGESLREPVGRIHWAGAETSTVWMNYMDGAVRSGERVAAEVLSALGDEPTDLGGAGATAFRR